VPVDEQHFPQFYYHHLPGGSPPLLFGGLEPTGPLPEAINFPMVESTGSTEFDCAILGDTQTYSNREIGPEYYSYDVGDVHFVGLDNVRYPCTPEVDNADGRTSSATTRPTTPPTTA
jgi:hypothetical protein